MRLSAIIVGSILGMGSSSAAVTWWTSDGTVGAPTTRHSLAPASTPDESPAAPLTLAAAGIEASEASPTPAATFVADGTVRLTSQVGHASLPALGPQETLLMVEVEGSREAAAESRAPVNLSIVIDRSGSMKGQRLTNAIAAARGMVARLRPDDTVSLIAYHSNAEVLLHPTRVAALDRSGFDRALARLRGRGHTCISCGIDRARELMRGRGEGVNRILLLSDGVANRGVTRTAGFRALGDQVRAERTAIASVGVDVDYDERSLFALSQASNGRHYFVENPSGLLAVFDQEAKSLVGTVADRVDVDVRLAEGVELLEVIARGHRRNEDGVSLSFGALAPGQERSALLRVRVDPQLGDRALASLSLDYRDVAQGINRHRDGSVGVRFDDALATVPEPLPEVEERLARKETLDALLDANEAFARGDVATANRALASARGRAARRRNKAKVQGGFVAPKVDKSYQRQLDALEQAQTSFDDAVVSSPAPVAAPKSRKGKKAIRLNAEAADPFG